MARSFWRIRNRPRTFTELQHRAVEHIASEGEVCVKRTSVVPSRPRGPTRTQPARVNETTTGREKPEGRRPYEARKPQPRGAAGGDRPAKERAKPARYNFVVELKDLIAVPNIVESLRRLAKSDKVLGPRKDSWCEFHEAFDHHIDNCLSLGYQLDELVRTGFLKDYVAEPATTAALPPPAEEQAHETPVLSEVHTIAGGFSGGGPTASQRKKYARGFNSIEERISVSRGNRTSCSQEGTFETWCRMTMTPWSFRLSQLEERCTEFLSTREVQQTSCSGRHSISYGCPLTF